MLKLIPPTIQYAESFLTQMRRKLADGLHPIGEGVLANVDDQIARWNEFAQNPVNGRFEYWLVDGNEYIGTFQLRRTESGMSAAMASHVYWQIDSQDHQDRATLNTLFELGIEKARGHAFSSLTFVISETDTTRADILEGHGGIHIAGIVSAIDGRRLDKYQFDVT